jgi:hypothetical protein
LRALIEEEEVATLSMSRDRLDFTSTDPYGFKSRLIGVIDSGTVTFGHVDGWTKAHYSVSFRRALAHVTAMTVLAFGVVPVMLMGWHPASLLFVVGAWTWLFGANYLMASARFKAVVRRTLEESRSEALAGATRGS